ncbi:Uncharacterised protein [Bordetella pertussis]|nr:Uncharacterised protein [Bordetella pertussis]
MPSISSSSSGSPSIQTGCSGATRSISACAARTRGIHSAPLARTHSHRSSRMKRSCGRASGSARAITSNCWPSRIMRSLTALMRSARIRTSSGRGRASISSDSRRSPLSGVRSWCAAWPMKRRWAASDASRRPSRSLICVTSGAISAGRPATSMGCMSSIERWRISSAR